MRFRRGFIHLCDKQGTQKELKKVVARFRIIDKQTNHRGPYMYRRWSETNPPVVLPKSKNQFQKCEEFAGVYVAARKSVHGYEDNADMVVGAGSKWVSGPYNTPWTVPRPRMHPLSPHCSSRSISCAFQEDGHLFCNLWNSESEKYSKSNCGCSIENGDVHK